MTGARFPHSEIPGSTLGCQLPGAYRRLPRPSSAPGAKASTVCSKKLETHSTKLKDARVHYAVLKTRTEPTPSHHQTTNTHPNGQDINAVWRPDQPVSRTKPPPGGPGLRSPSVNARSLRTQQCAQPDQPHQQAFPLPDPQKDHGGTNH
jgi:hypothetical protein